PTINLTSNNTILTANITNMSGNGIILNDIFSNNEIISSNLIINIDSESWPVNNITDNTANGFVLNYLTNISQGANTIAGFSINQNFPTWAGINPGPAGQGSFVDFTFFCGRGGGGGFAPSGLGSFFMGAYQNPSNKNYCFVAGDITIGTASPTQDNQFILGYNNGYTFGSGPRANFSVAAGATGDFVVSTNAVVADGNMNNSEMNPYISTDTFHIKYKGSTGTVSTLTFTNLGGTVPTLGSTNTFTANNTFSGHVVNSLSTQIALQPSTQTTTNIYSSSGQIPANDIFGGISIFNVAAPGLTFSLDSAANMEAVLTSAFGSGRAINETFWYTLSNVSAGGISVNLVGSSDFTILNGTITIPSGTTINARFKKVSSSPLGYLLVI
ncbi:MAG TPA: hypothetical protein VKG26_09520, partial [Bacteroidia bacterium]|nr:hypothetical protein [Bacteroidia bacterium]